MNFRYKVQITLKNGDYGTLSVWCRENIGQKHITWDRVGSLWEGKYRFRFKKDAAHFSLRWL